MSNYKITKTFEDRQKESKEIIEKYPNRIPLIIEKLVTQASIPFFQIFFAHTAFFPF